MKILLFVFLLNLFLAQKRTGSVDKSILDIKDEMNDFETNVNKAVNDKKKEEYQTEVQKIDDFIDQVEQEVEQHTSDTRILQFVEFDLIAQENCEYQPPVIPPYPEVPTEIDCLSAKYDAELLAKAVVEIKRAEPEPTDIVVRRMAECEIIGEKSMFVKLNVYELCLECEFKKLYEDQFKILKEKMESQGYLYDETTRTFTSKETETVTIKEQETVINKVLPK